MKETVKKQVLAQIIIERSQGKKVTKESIKFYIQFIGENLNPITKQEANDLFNELVSKVVLD